MNYLLPSIRLWLITLLVCVVGYAALLFGYGATAGNPVPADLVAASGGGLDPHISLAGALYQVDRVALARDMDSASLRDFVRETAFSPGWVFAPEPIVNVLQLNLALDRRGE